MAKLKGADTSIKRASPKKSARRKKEPSPTEPRTSVVKDTVKTLLEDKKGTFERVSFTLPPSYLEWLDDLVKRLDSRIQTRAVKRSEVLTKAVHVAQEMGEDFEKLFS